MKLADEINNFVEAQVDMRDKYQRDELEVKFQHIGDKSSEMLDSLQVSSGKEVEKMKFLVSDVGRSAQAIVPLVQRRNTLRGFTKPEFKVIDKAFNDVAKSSIKLSKSLRSSELDKITKSQIDSYLRDVLYFMKEMKPIMTRFNMIASKSKI